MNLTNLNKKALENSLHAKRSQFSKVGWEIRRIKEKLGIMPRRPPATANVATMRNKSNGTKK